MSPWLGIALVPGCLVLLLGGLAVLRRRGLHPELARKLLHIGMGLVTLSFPWLFREAWPVLLLTGLSIAGLLLVKLVPVLRGSVGDVVHGVRRSSLGEIYFPLAVASLFVLYRREGEVPPDQRLLLYCIPLLLLTLADALAALVGVKYGQSHYTTPDGMKSAEGSLAFFCCAFFCAHVLILLGSQVGRAESLLIALLLAWLAMMFEAVAWGGLDNLVMPLAAYLLLRHFLTLDPVQLGLRLGMAAALTFFVVVTRRSTTLYGSALVGAVLVGYVCWALGGWRWLAAPVIVFLCYARLSPQSDRHARRLHNVQAVVSVCSVSLLWLFLAVILSRPEMLFLFTLAFAAHLAIIGVIRIHTCRPTVPCLALLGLGAAPAWAFLFLPYFVMERCTSGALCCSLLALPLVGLAAAGFYLGQPGLPDCPVDGGRWLRQAFHAGLGSALGLVVLYLL